MTKRSLLPVMLALVLVVTPSLAIAAQSSHGGGENVEVAAARQHFKAGEKAFNAGDYTRALLEFEAGYVLVPRPGFLLNMGHTERRLGHPARARELYQRFLEADPESKQRDEVLGLIADIDRTLTATVPAKPEAEPVPAVPAPAVAVPVETPTTTPTPPAAPAAVVPLPKAPPPADEPTDLVSNGNEPVNEPSDERDDHQPVYKRWWFWAVMGVVAVGATTGIILATRPAAPSFQKDGSLGRVGGP